MSQFKEYKNLNLIDVAENVAEFWKQNKTFNKSVEIRQGNPEFVFTKVRLQQTVCPNSPRNGKSIERYFLPLPDSERKAGFP